MRFIHDTGTGHRLMRQTAGCTKQTIALLNNGGQGIYATSWLKHGPLVPHARYWHCYDRSPRASVITMPISGMWHSGPCFNLCLYSETIDTLLNGSETKLLLCIKLHTDVTSSVCMMRTLEMAALLVHQY